MIVRWLGAFRNDGTVSTLEQELANMTAFHDGLQFEERSAESIRCAEASCLSISGYSWKYRPLLGLLVSRKSVIRRFKTDVWAEPVNDGSGRLMPTSKGNDSWNEFFVKPDYVAVIIRKAAIKDKELLRQVSEVAHAHGLTLLHAETLREVKL